MCFEISDIAYNDNYFVYISGSYKQFIINQSISKAYNFKAILSSFLTKLIINLIEFSLIVGSNSYKQEIIELKSIWLKIYYENSELCLAIEFKKTSAALFKNLLSLIKYYTGYCIKFIFKII